MLEVVLVLEDKTCNRGLALNRVKDYTFAIKISDISYTNKVICYYMYWVFVYFVIAT